MILLDTNTVSYILQQRPSTLASFLAVLKAGESTAISAVGHFESLTGLHRANKPVLAEAYQRLIASFDILPFDSHLAALAATLVADNLRQGRGPLHMDMMIAATALGYAAPLVTNNTKHFAHIPKLELLNWA